MVLRFFNLWVYESFYQFAELIMYVRIYRFPRISASGPNCYQTGTKLIPKCYQTATKLLPLCCRAATKRRPNFPGVGLQFELCSWNAEYGPFHMAWTPVLLLVLEDQRLDCPDSEVLLVRRCVLVQ